MSTLSDNLKYYRKLSGLTTRQVADMSGISQNTYIGWETGYRQPRNLDNLDQIASVFGITKDYLLYDRNGNTITVEEKKRRSEHEENTLLNAYNRLNEEARKRLVLYAEDLLKIKEYRSDEDISEAKD